MSLSLAQTWIRTTIHQRAAQAEALQLLERAAADGVEATLIAGNRLTANGRSYLGRWDGQELVVLEVPRGELQAWRIDPKGLFQQLDTPKIATPVLAAEPLITISAARIDSAKGHDGREPMSGTCRFDFDDLPTRAIHGGALRAEYFRPDLPQQITAMFYVDDAIREPFGMLRFSFPSLFSKGDAERLEGTLVVFLQLFSSDNWVNKVGARKISNVTPAFVRLRAIPPCGQ